MCSYASAIPPNARIGIFPIHLDPPTLQHQQIFRLLLDLDERVGSHPSQRSCRPNSKLQPPPQGPESMPGSALSSPRIPAAEDCRDSGCGIYVPPSFAYLNSFARSLRQDSQLAPFDDLILVPNTRYPVNLRESTHLAALAVLATRGLPHVHIEFAALEHPDESMPIISELCYRYPNAALVHWLHDAYEMQGWCGFSDMKLQVPLLLLQTASYPPAALSQHYDGAATGVPAVLYSKLYQPPEGAAELSGTERGYYRRVQSQLDRISDYRCNRHLHQSACTDATQRRVGGGPLRGARRRRAVGLRRRRRRHAGGARRCVNACGGRGG
ncbi:hypothetical protein STCU_09992 [Strigomonas culicis]|uniref:Uncharacterized protein n=1 Tax=Strigomonas culicis TaxID=28005 RepID=S9TJR9_9TRYP|nr:hypothetical protein STCU_09992 [Strigomonas culicis]|eukprot:EPY18382.1 hypothetical protein STCU_09992 [Strigomonas culicis]